MFAFLPFFMFRGKGTPTSKIKLLNNHHDFSVGSRNTHWWNEERNPLCFLYLGQYRVGKSKFTDVPMENMIINE